MLLTVLLAAAILPLPDHRIDLRGGEKQEYVVPLRQGEFVQLVVEQLGIDVVVTTYAPDGAKLAEIDSPNGANGPEPVPLGANVTGHYRIEVRSFDDNAKPGQYTVRIAERLTPAQYRKRLAAERARDEAVIAWMRARAIPVTGDLRPLFSDARVVGLGEATHGSHEIFELKNDLIRFLVTRMGFTLVAFEGSVTFFETLDDYIAGRTDRETALAALNPGGWITDTQELVSLLDWLRAHNAAVPAERRVRLVGLDPQVSGPAIDFLRAYLGPRFHPLLESVRVQDQNAIRFERTDTSQVLDGLRRLLAYLIVNEGDLVRRTSAAEHRRAVDGARLLLQFAEFNASLPPGEGGTRDQYMADHLFRAMGPDTRAVVWSHNSHIAARQTGSYPPMGGFLREAFGAGYYALATAFDRGAFQAQVARVSPPQVREFSVPAAAEGSIDFFLARATDGTAIVDLRRDPPSDPRIAEWLQTPHPMHWVGAIYSDQSSPWQPFILARDFDGVAIIDSTTRARPRQPAR
jgi:erythromycin esterase